MILLLSFFKKRTRMLKKNSFFLTIVLMISSSYAGKYRTIDLDDLQSSAPNNWHSYLRDYSLKEILKAIESHKNYKSMTDDHGNNLLLAFIEFDYREYKTTVTIYDKSSYPYEYYFKAITLPTPKPLTKDKIQQFFDKGFDINFQNSRTKNTLLMNIINSSSNCKDYIALDLIQWLISKHKPDLNLKNKTGYTALLYSYHDYNIMAFLLKHGARRSLPERNGDDRHMDSSKEVVQLETMMGAALTNLCYIQNKEARDFMTLMYKYERILDQINQNDYTIKHTNELLTKFMVWSDGTSKALMPFFNVRQFAMKPKF